MTGQTIYLIPDTNRIWTEEEGPPTISGSFISTVKAMDGHYTVKVKIPELVFQEFVAQRKRALKKQIESLTKAATALETMTGTQPVIPDELVLAATLEATFRKQITELGYEIIPTPVAQIPWSEVISAAINRQPPFEIGKSEKGFRDAVIMHTVLYYVATDGNEENTYFVATDKLLREATRAKNAKLGVFPSMDEFQGHLRLLEEKVDKDIALSLQAEAGLAFFSPKTGLGFLIEHKVRSKIFHELGHKFTRCSDEPSRYTRYGNEEIEKASTSFVGQPAKGIYEWKTILDFAVGFSSPLGLPSIKKIVSVSVVWTARYSEKSFSAFEFKSLAPEGERIEEIPLARASSVTVNERLAASATPAAWEESLRLSRASLASLANPSGVWEESLKRSQEAINSLVNPSSVWEESLRRSQATINSLINPSSAWEESLRRSQTAINSLVNPSHAWWTEALARNQETLTALANPSAVFPVWEELVQRRQADIAALIAPHPAAIEAARRSAQEFIAHQPVPPTNNGLGAQGSAESGDKAVKT